MPCNWRFNWMTSGVRFFPEGRKVSFHFIKRGKGRIEKNRGRKSDYPRTKHDHGNGRFGLDGFSGGNEHIWMIGRSGQLFRCFFWGYLGFWDACGDCGIRDFILWMGWDCLWTRVEPCFEWCLGMLIGFLERDRLLEINFKWKFKMKRNWAIFIALDL